MSRRPSMQFYTADWQGNSKLKRCTHEEKGIWADILCVLHDQQGDGEHYGVVRWTLKELARAVGTTPAKVQKLVDKGVLKGSAEGVDCEEFIYVPRSGRRDGEPVTLIEKQAGPIWYSSRMVVDEHKRRNAGSSTRFAAQKTSDEPPPAASPSQRQGDGRGGGKGDGSTPTPSSSTSNNKTPYLGTARAPAVAQGVFEDGVLEGAQAAPLRYDIRHHLSDRGLAMAKQAAPGWDVYGLAETYNEGIRSGKRAVPDIPDRAFPAWCGKYTYGRPPA